MNWQPIETAPRDGTEILLWEQEFDLYAVGIFSELQQEWIGWEEWSEPMNPSHWMPLPEPPEED